MENTGVTCDVCECRHNVEACKCDLPQIKGDGALHLHHPAGGYPALLPELRKEIICTRTKTPRPAPFSDRA